MPLDVYGVLAELAPYLNAASTGDADFYFWTGAELLQFADDAVKQLARKTLCFATIPGAIAFSAAQPTATLPEGAIAVIAAAWNNLPLRESNVSEVEALDDAWDSTPGTPKKWLDDVGLGIVRTYPVSASGGSLTVIVQAFPAAISMSQTTVEAPAPFGGFLLEAMMGRARQKQSDAMMPEVAEHCAQRVAMYEQVFAEYWGSGE